MSDPAHQLLEEIRDELHQLRLLETARARVDDGTPLSRAEVCRILHIDMRSTLMPLIKQKLVKTVPWTKDEVRVPVSELRRLQREGIPAVSRRERRPVPASSSRAKAREDAKAAAAGIRSIKIK